jgi:hypothetical protein
MFVFTSFSWKVKKESESFLSSSQKYYTFPAQRLADIFYLFLSVAITKLKQVRFTVPAED